MQTELRIDLPKLANREYLHGTSMFNTMLELCERTWGLDCWRDASISSFKLIRRSDTNGKFVVADEPVDGLNANVELVGRTAQRKIFVYFVEEGRGAERETYDEEQYYRVVRVGADFSGEFVLPAGKPRADVIRGIVGANKCVHQKAGRFAVEPKRIRFLYLKGFDTVCLHGCADEYRLRISNLMVQEHDAEVWTINRVAVGSLAFNTEFRICYSAAN